MKEIKILQVNTVCGKGSVGRIMVELYKLSEKQGFSPLIAYGRDEADAALNTYKIGTRSDFYRHVLRNFFLGESGFGSKNQTREFIQWIETQKPDLIHLHNIHGFYLQIEELFAYLKKANLPVVWTLHDCWPFTGHCAFFDYIECDKYKTGCHDCGIHRSAYPYALFKDNSKNAYQNKKQAFCGVKKLTIVTPSNWLKEVVGQSFLKDYPVQVIYNGIDLEAFAPLNQVVEGMMPDKKIILGVANVWEKRKGLVYFEQLANRLPKEYQIVLVGLSDKQRQVLSKKYTKDRLLPLGRTNGVKELAALYGAADLYVNATLEDNFPTTNLEALACGTPVLTFDTGGSKESLDETCGRWVKKGDMDELIGEILSMTKHPKRQEACRKKALEFDAKKRFEEYIDLYRKELNA